MCHAGLRYGQTEALLGDSRIVDAVLATLATRARSDLAAGPAGEAIGYVMASLARLAKPGVPASGAHLAVDF